MARQVQKRNPYLIDYTAYRNERMAAAKSVGDSVNYPASKNRIAREKRRKRRMRRRRLLRGGILLATACVCGLLLAGVIQVFRLLGDSLNGHGRGETTHMSSVRAESLSNTQNEGGKDSGQSIQGIPADLYEEHPSWTENFLTVNEYSRPGDALGKVENIFVHYTANKGTSAAQNRSYFEQLKDTHERSASAHFIIGYDGEIIQCIPLDEIAYAVQTRNNDSISIECCYQSDDGSFTQETYDSLLKLLGWLMKTYDLEADDILRHYDCGGKKCPAYYVKHEDAWKQLKKEAGEL